jgi:sugar phosphate isomerase/epimerase
MAAGFRLGVVHYASFPNGRDDEAAFWASLDRLLADPSLGAIELHTFLQPSWLARIRSAFEPRDKYLLLSAGPRLLEEQGLCALDRASRRSAVELCKKLIDVAREVSATSLMVISGKDPGPDLRLSAQAALEDSLHELCSYASLDKRPFMLSLETFARTRPPFQLVGPTAEAATLADRVSSTHDNFRLTIDLSHLAQLGEDPVASVKTLGARVRHIHLSTCVVSPGHPVLGDFHPSFRAAGVAVTLQSAGRALAVAAASSPDAELTVSVEVRPQAGEDAAQIYEQSRSDLLSTVRMAAEQVP